MQTLTLNCPDCNKVNPLLLESRMTVRGVRRRRYECKGCRHRWTLFTKENKGRPYKPNGWDAYKGRMDEWRSLSRTQAKAIILSNKPQRKLAEDYGISRQAISLIQTGRIYKDIYEEIHPPRTGPMIYCASCTHWSRDRCGFEFPDAGDTFATECSVYQSK